MEGGGKGVVVGLSLTEGASERARERPRKAGVSWPSSLAGEEEERAEDGRPVSDWMCQRCQIFRRSNYHAGPAAVSHRAVWEEPGLNRCLEIPNKKKKKKKNQEKWCHERGQEVGGGELK